MNKIQNTESFSQTIEQAQTIFIAIAVVVILYHIVVLILLISSNRELIKITTHLEDLKANQKEPEPFSLDK